MARSCPLGVVVPPQLRNSKCIIPVRTEGPDEGASAPHHKPFKNNRAAYPRCCSTAQGCSTARRCSDGRVLPTSTSHWSSLDAQASLPSHCAGFPRTPRLRTTAPQNPRSTALVPAQEPADRAAEARFGVYQPPIDYMMYLHGQADPAHPGQGRPRRGRRLRLDHAVHVLLPGLCVPEGTQAGRWSETGRIE